MSNKKTMENFRCCICHKLFTGYGNDPYPIEKNGRCCDECNGKVIQIRLLGIKTNEEFKKAMNNLKNV